MKKIVFIISIFFTIHLAAQNLELDKVTKTELEEKFNPSDSSAVATILFKKATTKFNYDFKNGFTSRTEFSIKIKIYKKEGLKWANFEIPYYIGYNELNDEQVTILKTYTYNLENGKILKEKVTGEGKFKEKVNEFWETKIVAFSNVKVGSIIELKYEFKSENLSELPFFQYQYEIPVNYARYITEIPIFYIYQATKEGFVDVLIDDKIENNSIDYEDEYHRSNNLNFKQIKTIYEASKIPALVEEDYVSNIDDYYGKIKHELKTIQFPNKPVDQITTSWESLAKSIYSEKKFGLELNKTSYFLNDLRRILEKIESKQERLKVIFEYLKNKMTWDGKYGYLTKKGVEDAYANNVGNAAEINLILTSMLKTVGFDANPVLISTRENGVALFPNRSKFNYVISCVALEGKQYLLDATNKYCSIYNLPLRDLNNVGRLIKMDGSSLEINLIPNYSSVYNVTAMANIDKEGSISGQIREKYLDYQALRFRGKYSGIAAQSNIEQLEKKHSGLEIVSYELKNDKQVYEPVILDYAFKNKNVAEIIGNKIFFSPMLFFAKNQNPFTQETRSYPIDFTYPYQDKYVIVINIPDGYSVESIPKEETFNLDNDLGSFSYKISVNENQIQAVIVMRIETAIVSSKDYPNLKLFFKNLIAKENEKIVLKKS